MLDVSFTELALIVVVAFLILGPKELPVVIKALSNFLRQCREVVDECKAQLESLSDDSCVKDVRDAIKGETKYIQDQFGNWQETYDLSDILAAKRQDAALPAPEEAAEEAGVTPPAQRPDA